MEQTETAIQKPLDQKPQNVITTRLGWRELLIAFAVPLLVFLVLTPHQLDWLNPPTGDEPSYLTTTISLIQDHDLDETNQYANHDYWQFFPTCNQIQSVPNWGSSSLQGHATDNTQGVFAPGLPCPTLGDFQYLPPHTSKGVVRPGQYTKHGLGLSFLIVPAYWLAGRVGAVVFINFLAALLALNLFLLAYEASRKRWVAWLVWASMVFSVPLLSHSFLIFPAIPAALCTLYAWRRLRLAAQARLLARENHNNVLGNISNVWQMAGIAACIGFLPWLHSLYLSVSVPLLVYWWVGGRDFLANMWRWVRKPFRFPILASDISLLGFGVACAILVIFGGLYLTYFIYYYGTPLPNAQDHIGFMPLDELWKGTLGLLFDQKWGLLIYAPLYLIPLAGVVLLFFRSAKQSETRARHSDLLWILLTTVPNYLISADFKLWWGEWCPPARYLVPIVPLLAVPFAVILVEMRGWIVRSFYIVAAIWTALVSITIMVNPHLEFHWQDTNPAKILLWLQQNVGFLHSQNVGAWFPSYVTPLEPDAGIGAWLAPLLWAGGAVALVIAMLWETLQQRHQKQNKAVRTEITRLTENLQSS